MKARWLATIAGLMIVALVGAPYASATPSNLTNYSFEQSTMPMLPDGNFGHEHNTLLQGTDESSVCVFDPEGAHHYARLTTGPLGSDIVWFETSTHAEGPVVVQLAWTGRAVYNCGNCTMLAYAGEVAPEADDLRNAGRLTANWRTYQYLTNLEPENTIFVAVGFQVERGKIPPEMVEVGIDCLSIRVDSNARAVK